MVVNDLGGSPNGEGGGDARPAEVVVNEIKAKGICLTSYNHQLYNE